jgi:hypothetical protein
MTTTTLEQIAKEHGMTEDYVDTNTGNIYQLTDAIDDGNGGLLIPVIAPYGDSILLGYAKMQKPE